MSYKLQLDQAKSAVLQVMAVAHNPSLGGVGAVLGRTGLGNDLPVSIGSLQSLASGNYTSALNGLLGSLTQQNFDRNHVYTCTNASAACAASQANAKSIAGMQGAAQAVDEDIRQHAPAMQALRDRLASAQDVKDVADIQGQIETEQLWTNNTVSRLNAIKANFEVEQLAQQQQANETIDKSFEDFHKMAEAQ